MLTALTVQEVCITCDFVFFFVAEVILELNMIIYFDVAVDIFV